MKNNGFMKSKSLLIGGVVLVVILAAGYMLYAKKTTYAPSTSAPISTPAVTQKANKEFAISATEFKFSPASLSVKKGDVVKVTFTNNGTTSHSFTIDELGVLIGPTLPGASDSQTFTADKTGTFTYYCNVDGHKGFGMKGVLDVK